MFVKKVTLDELLDKFELNQRYHIQLALLTIFGFMTNTTYCFNFIFAFEEVNYRCITQNISQAYCISKSNETCEEWIYDKPDSFVAEFDLACQDWKRTAIGTVHSFGTMCGLLLIGPFSDRVGRKTATIITGTLGGIFGIIKSFSNTYIFYIVVEFLEAALGDLCTPLYVLSLEFVSKEKRVLFILIIQLGFTMGRISFAAIAWLLPNRRMLLRALYAPALFFTLYLFLIDESPRWLLNKEPKKSAVLVLEKIAKTNKVVLDKGAYNNLVEESEASGTNSEALKHTLQSRLLRIRLLICLIWWVTSTFVSFGMKINSVSLEGDKHLNYILLALPEIPATLSYMYILKRYKRKKPLMFCFLAAAAFCLAQPFMPSDLPWLSILLFIAGNLMSTSYLVITYLYTSELFPTYTRNSMLALCSSFGRIGSLSAPQTPLLMPYWSGLPSILFGSMSLIAGLVTFFVPDVGDDSLPDTVKQAETVGKPKVMMDHRIDQTNSTRF